MIISVRGKKARYCAWLDKITTDEVNALVNDVYEQGRKDGIDELAESCKFTYCNGHDVSEQIWRIAERIKVI